MMRIFDFIIKKQILYNTDNVINVIDIYIHIVVSGYYK